MTQRSELRGRRRYLEHTGGRGGPSVVFDLSVGEHPPVVFTGTPEACDAWIHERDVEERSS